MIQPSKQVMGHQQIDLQSRRFARVRLMLRVRVSLCSSLATHASSREYHVVLPLHLNAPSTIKPWSERRKKTGAANSHFSRLMYGHPPTIGCNQEQTSLTLSFFFSDDTLWLSEKFVGTVGHFFLLK